MLGIICLFPIQGLLLIINFNWGSFHLSPCCRSYVTMQHYGVNGYSLHAMNSLSAMYNLHQQAAQQAQHAPDYRPSVHALTLAERLAGKNNL